jgi:tRNA(Ile)-lysidine synthase TilS/MesJ
MTMTGRGNVTGLHWSKKSSEEFIREFCRKNELEVKQYDLDYKTAREIASDIRFFEKVVFLYPDHERDMQQYQRILRKLKERGVI